MGPRAAVAAEDLGSCGSPGVATLALALVGAVALGDPGRGPDDPLHGMLSVIIEWSALVASAAIWAWQPEARGRRRFCASWRRCGVAQLPTTDA